MEKMNFGPFSPSSAKLLVQKLNELQISCEVKAINTPNFGVETTILSHDVSSVEIIVDAKTALNNRQQFEELGLLWPKESIETFSGKQIKFTQTWPFRTILLLMSGFIFVEFFVSSSKDVLNVVHVLMTNKIHELSLFTIVSLLGSGLLGLFFAGYLVFDSVRSLYLNYIKQT